MEIRDQCMSVKDPFFFKQWGGVQKKRAGRTLEGRTWDEMPKNLVRAQIKSQSVNGLAFYLIALRAVMSVAFQEQLFRNIYGVFADHISDVKSIPAVIDR